jgi:hypothetical protein
MHRGVSKRRGARSGNYVVRQEDSEEVLSKTSKQTIICIIILFSLLMINDINAKWGDYVKNNLKYALSKNVEYHEVYNFIDNILINTKKLNKNKMFNDLKNGTLSLIALIESKDKIKIFKKEIPKKKN